MPAFHAHDDDFLHQIQYPAADKEPKESHKAADELLERFLRRHRLQNPCTRCPEPQPQPAGVVGIDVTSEIVRAFQSVWKDHPAKHPPRPRVQRVWPYLNK